MKGATIWLVLALVAGPGCVSLPTTWQAEKKEAPPVRVEAKPVPALPVVTADQVNETNAYEKAQALKDELDRESQKPGHS